MDDSKPHSEFDDTSSPDMEEALYARHVEIEALEDLMKQRGTPIPALFTSMFKFISNPSSISVDTFKRMVDTDDTTGSGVDFLTTCLAARLGRYTHKNKEISAWVNASLDKIEGGWNNTVKEILSASWAGFYVGEKVWANTDRGFIIQRVAPLPPTTVLFEVERDGRLSSDGILQYQRNWVPGGLASGFFGGVVGPGNGFTGGGSADPFAKLGDLPFPLRTANTFNYLSIRIPVRKCIHYSFDAQGKFGNPYGRSLLRRCYKYYVLKDAFLRMLATALDRKGTPLTVVYADNNTTVLDPTKAGSGNNKGKSVGKRADQAAAEAFKNIHNDSVIVLPGKEGAIYKATTLSQDSNAEAFMGAIDLCNRSILRALLIPALIFGSGDGSGSFALGQEHAKTFDKILDGVLSGLTQVLLQQVVFELIAYNFPRELWDQEGLGEFSKRELTTDERQKELETLDKAVSMGAVDMNDINDLNVVRERAGFGPRETPIPKPEMPDSGDDGLDSLKNKEEKE